MAISRESDDNDLTHASRWLLTRFLIVGFVLGIVEPAISQEWQIEPSIEVVATYTDNLFLAVEGDEASSFVGQINPAISVLKEQGRFTTDTYFRLQSILFAESSDFNAVLLQLDTTSTLDVVSERFFVALNGSIDQAVVDPIRGIPTSNIVVTENLGDVYLADVNPYFIQPLGASTFLRLDYLWGMGQYDGFGLADFSRVDDFTRDTGRVYLGRGQQETGFEWSLIYDSDRIDYENVSDYRFERAQVSIGIPIARQFRLVGIGGQESDLLASRQMGGLESDFWEVGFRINTGPGKSFEVRTGERFFGTTYYGNFEFEGRRLSLSITYSETPMTSALGGDLGGLSIPFGAGDNPAEADEAPVEDATIIGPIRASVYISNSLNGRITLTGNRSTLYLSHFDELREFLDEPGLPGEDQEEQRATTLGFIYRLGSRSSLDISAMRSKYEYANTVVSTELNMIELGFLRRLGSATDLRVAVRHVKQFTDSVSGFDNYTEKAIDVGLVKRF